MNSPSHLQHGLWRMKQSRSNEYNDLQLWVDLAKLAEETKIDGIFFADVIGLFDAPNWKDVPQNAVQFPSSDPAMILGTMAYATENVAFIYTGNVLLSHPFTFARQASTLDHLSNGRIGWNVVCGASKNGARSFGHEDIEDHETRYARTDEYVDITYKLWEGSMDPGAVLKDQEEHVYVDPKKIHKINHVSKNYSVEGPHLVEPSPQRMPVIYQAGASGPGIAFAAKHAEAVFLISASPEGARKKVTAIKELAVKAGRREDDIHFVEGIMVIVGETLDEAKAKEVEFDKYASATAHTIQFSGAGGIDFSKHSPDELLEDLIDQAPGMRGSIEMVINGVKGRKATVQDLASSSTKGIRAVGTPDMIIDRFQEFIDVGITGFNILSMTLPSSVEDFCRLVAPELKKRGMMRSEFPPGTMREKMFPGRDSMVNERHPAFKYRNMYKENE
jgi:FMN-dependent oxidoreductase (nitrilotriacetate monooxygenase family)